MALTCSGRGSGAQQTLSWWGNTGEEKSSDTLLGFETTGPLSLRPECGIPEVGCCSPLLGGGPRPGYGLGLVVVALLWWWGVVFDLWIVVASISHTVAPAPFWGVGVVGVR